MSRGFVYILSNEFMPGLVKIGKTTRSVEGRSSELYQSGVPAPFKVEHEILTPDCSAMEAEAHDQFSDYRVSESREFFRVSPSVVHEFLVELLDVQVRELVDDYIPDHTLVEYDYLVDPSTISIIALVTGVQPQDVRLVLDEIRCDDEVFDFGVLQARLEARRVRNKSLVDWGAF